MDRAILRVVPVIVAMLFTGCKNDIFESKSLSNTVWNLKGEYYEKDNEQSAAIQFLSSDGFTSEVSDFSRMTYQDQGLTYYGGSYLLSKAISGFDPEAIFEIGNSAGTVYTNSIPFRTISVAPLENMELGEPYTVSWMEPIAENETVYITIYQVQSDGSYITIPHGSSDSIGETSYIFENTNYYVDSSQSLKVLVRRVYMIDLLNNGGLTGGTIYSSYVAAPIDISVIDNF